MKKAHRRTSCWPCRQAREAGGGGGGGG